METILFEKPFLIGLLGGITAVVLAFLWLQTALRPVLYALIAVLAVTLFAIVLAVVVETEREAVNTALLEAAAAVQRNDVAGLVRRIHPQAQAVRQQAEAEMPRYDFQEVKIKPNLVITFDKTDQPTEAVAKFNVSVVVSDRDGLIKNRRVPRYCSVTFRKHDGAWRMFAYEHDDPREGLLQR